MGKGQNHAVCQVEAPIDHKGTSLPHVTLAVLSCSFMALAQRLLTLQITCFHTKPGFCADISEAKTTSGAQGVPILFRHYTVSLRHHFSSVRHAKYHSSVFSIKKSEHPCSQSCFPNLLYFLRSSSPVLCLAPVFVSVRTSLM